MKVKVTYSNNYKAKMARIKRLPVLVESALEGGVQRDLLEINKDFHDGIKKDKLNLERLAGITIEEKEKQGLPEPETPLYGGGDDEGERAYMNMMLITKRGKYKWGMRPSKRKHWSGNITLDKLFKIHEFGAIVKKKTKEGVKLITIPPRPALHLAWLKWLKRKGRNKKEQSKEVRKAIRGYINDGSKELEKIYMDMKRKIEESM